MPQVPLVVSRAFCKMRCAEWMGGTERGQLRRSTGLLAQGARPPPRSHIRCRVQDVVPRLRQRSGTADEEGPKTKPYGQCASCRGYITLESLPEATHRRIGRLRSAGGGPTTRPRCLQRAKPSRTRPVRLGIPHPGPQLRFLSTVNGHGATDGRFGSGTASARADWRLEVDLGYGRDSTIAGRSSGMLSRRPMDEARADPKGGLSLTLALSGPQNTVTPRNTRAGPEPGLPAS